MDYDKLIQLILAREWDEILRLIDTGEIDVNSRRDEYDRTVLYYAVSFDRMDANLGLVKQLLERQANVNFKYNSDCRTILMEAKTSAMIELLISYGADMYVRNAYNEDVIKWLVGKNRLEAVRKMKELGCNFKVITREEGKYMLLKRRYDLFTLLTGIEVSLQEKGYLDNTPHSKNMEKRKFNEILRRCPQW